MKNSAFKLIGMILAVLVSGTACNKIEDEIAIEISPSENVAVIATSRNSCAQIATGDTSTKAIGSPSFEIPSLKYVWKGQNDATLIRIKVTLQSSFFAEGSQTLTIAGDDLIATLCGTDPQVPCAKLLLTGNDTTERAASCSLRMGGLQFIDVESPAFGSGTIEFYAVETTDKGDRAVRGEAAFSFFYDGD